MKTLIRNPLLCSGSDLFGKEDFVRPGVFDNCALGLIVLDPLEKEDKAVDWVEWGQQVLR